MRSELKPCPLAKALLVAADEVSACGGGNEAEIMRAAAKKLAERNTCAVPDVSGLQRYSLTSGNSWQKLEPDCNGKYVLYSEAAAIIAAKGAEINLYQSVHRWSVDDDGSGILYVCRHEHDKSEACEWDKFVPYERAEAAEAKLAQIEKKTP